MRLHRFYIDQRIGGDKEISLSDTEMIHQILYVFRFKIGNQVLLFDGSGFEYVSEIVSLSKKEIIFNILSQAKKNEGLKNISLYLALIKKGNFELSAEKCTEVGVMEIHPIISERSEKKDLNLERLNKIVKEASEQSGRVTLPKIYEVSDLETAILQAIENNKICVTFHPTSPRSFEGTGTNNNVAVFIGPEGGWTDKEMELFKKNNFQICNLGQNIFARETAAIISVYCLYNK